jgi:hypothetical protein
MNFYKLTDDLDVGPLERRLVGQPNLFGRRMARADSYAHGAMTDIWVRYNAPENQGPHFNDEHDSVWYPESEEMPEVRPVCHALMWSVWGTRLGGVLITKLPPGGKIHSHVDGGWHAGYYKKFYVPIVNDEGAVFGFPEGEIHAKPGEVWAFRNDVPHWVNNDSQRDRIAMIVCIRT